MNNCYLGKFYYVAIKGTYTKYGDGSSMLYNDVVCASSKKEAIKVFCRGILNPKNYDFIVFPIQEACFIRVNNFGCFVCVSNDRYCGVVDLFTLSHSAINYILTFCKFNKE